LNEIISNLFLTTFHFFEFILQRVWSYRWTRKLTLNPMEVIMTTTIKDLPLSQIRIDYDMQKRVKIDEATVNEYAEALERGDMFPPIIVYEIDGEHDLADGFHRYLAYEKCGRDTIPCDIRQGTLDDAREFACCANKGHGLKTNDADKRKAAKDFFSIPGRDALTNTEAAKRLGVSVPFVATVRKELGIKPSPASHHGKGSDKWQEANSNDVTLKPTESNDSVGNMGLNVLIPSAVQNGSKTINVDLPVSKPHEFVTALMEHVEIKFMKSCRDYLNDLLND
jgi:uncharacterized ParB-like nuclease family protein